MSTEYRLAMTAMFKTAADRDKAYGLLKTQLAATATKEAGATRSDMTKDEYDVADPKITGYEAFLF